MRLRKARASDLAEIRKIDRLARASTARGSQIAAAIRRRACYVAVMGSHVAGYCVFEYSFFERGFVSMLLVDDKLRRNGIGSALMHHIESVCRSRTLFTSTNASNARMRKLLMKLGYRKSGRVNDLDPSDPELFYSKRIRSHTTARR